MNDFDEAYHFRFYRDSREAFGVRFQVEKPSRDWLWFAASVALVIAVAMVLI